MPIDDNALLEQVRANIRPRLADAAEYHSRKVFDATPGGGTPARWESSGDSAKSIRYVLSPDGSEHMGWKMVVEPFYMAFYEFGSKHQPARPFLRNATIESIPGIISIIEEGSQN